MIRIEWSPGDEFIFAFFRYNPEANQKIARLEGARFFKEDRKRGWELPASQYGRLHELFPGSIVGPPAWRVLGQDPPPPPEWWQKIEPSLTAPFPEISKEKPLFPYQVKGANFGLIRLLDSGMACIFDEMGLGKTPQGIAVAAALRNRHRDRAPGPILWVTKAPLVLQTVNEGFREFADLRAVPIVGDAKQRKKLWWQEADAYVCGYELILRDTELIRDLRPSLIIFDEAHKIKNREGKMYQQFYELIRTVNASVLMLTGTPVQNKPEELYALFALHPHGEKQLGSWTAFSRKYILTRWNGKYREMEGYAHLNELATLIEPYYIRRERGDVGIEIPKAIGDKPHEQWVEPTPEQQQVFAELAEREDQIKQKIKQAEPGEVDELREKQQGTQMVQMVAAGDPCLLATAESQGLRKRFGHLHDARSPKRDAFCELVPTLVESGKVLVFSQFRRQVLKLGEELDRLGIGYVFYTSSESAKKREENKEALRHDPTVKVMLATDAASDGLNLQVCRSVVHYDTPWNPFKFDQRNGRVMRPNSPHSEVLLVQLLCEGSIDVRILESNKLKRDLSDTLIIA